MNGSTPKAREAMHADLASALADHLHNLETYLTSWAKHQETLNHEAISSSQSDRTLGSSSFVPHAVVYDHTDMVPDEREESVRDLLPSIQIEMDNDIFSGTPSSTEEVDQSTACASFLHDKQVDRRSRPSSSAWSVASHAQQDDPPLQRISEISGYNQANARPSSFEARWHQLTRRLLLGGRVWKIDPVWEANLQIRNKQSLKKSSSFLPKIVTVLAQYTLETTDRTVTQRRRCCLRHLIPPFHPNASIKHVWDLLSIFLLFYDFIMLPLAVFDDTSVESSAEVKFYVACFWTADMLVSFVTGYYSVEGFVEMQFSRIAKHYLKSHFFIDLSVTVLDWFLIGFTTRSTVSGILRFMFRGARGLRLLRLNKGLQRMSLLTENICTEYIIVGLDIFGLLVCVFLASHYTACAWYGLSRVEINDNLTPRNWAQLQLDGSGNIGYAYTTSLHWALTQFTPASMEVVPVNSLERSFTCIVILTALVIFSSFVSSITQAMTYLRQINNQKRTQECTIRKFLKQRNITPDTSVQLWRFVKRHKLTESSLVRETDVVIFQQLPSHLRIELKQQLYIPFLVAHPLFTLVEACEKDFIGVLCNECLTEVQVSAGVEAIVAEAEIRDMVFVIRGKMEYVSHEELQPVFVTEKEWVCELALWANRVRLPGTLLGCDRGAELALLNSTSFRKVARKSCSNFNFLADYAIHFVSIFRAMTQFDSSTRWSDTSACSASISTSAMSLAQSRGAPMARKSRSADWDSTPAHGAINVPVKKPNRPTTGSTATSESGGLSVQHYSSLYSACAYVSRSSLFNEPEVIDLLVADVAADHPVCGMMYRKLMKDGALDRKRANNPFERFFLRNSSRSDT